MGLPTARCEPARSGRKQRWQKAGAVGPFLLSGDSAPLLAGARNPPVGGRPQVAPSSLPRAKEGSAPFGNPRDAFGAEVTNERATSSSSSSTSIDQLENMSGKEKRSLVDVNSMNFNDLLNATSVQSSHLKFIFDQD